MCSPRCMRSSPDDARILIPRVRVKRQGEILRDEIGAILLEQRHEARAARTTRHPQHEGISERIISRLEEPVPQVALQGWLRAVHGNVPGPIQDSLRSVSLVEAVVAR